MIRDLSGLDYLPMTVAVALWSGTYIAGTFAVSDLPPGTLLFLRYAVATAVSLPVMICLEPRGWRMPFREAVPLMAVGITGMFGNNLFFFMALSATSVLNVAIIFAVTPFITMILAALFAGEPLELRRGLAILVALTGVLILLTGGDVTALRSLRFNRGDLYELMAALCAAACTVIARRVAFRHSPLVVTGYGMAASTALAVPLAMAGPGIAVLGSVSPRGWASLAYLALLASCLAYVLQQISVKRIGANRTAAFINLSPAMTVVLAAIFLGETLTAIQAVSAGIIVAGVALNAAP